ncbi:MAG: hypothetical protein C5S38_08220 [Candidatus Methanophagaceae archaeon]|nr:MAG: hypothetical protein C5S38_08220 [Methanophagales archaeon]KAF5429950.1 hypothetical protein C5S36_14255 [Methanophagales archaeon]
MLSTTDYTDLAHLQATEYKAGLLLHFADKSLRYKRQVK